MSEKKCLSVTELSTALNKALEMSLSDVTFQGEISEFTCAPSGHCYMTIKDSQSQINAVMWRFNVSRLKFKPKCGDVVICVGTPNVYNKSGRLQIVLQSMTPAGEGELKRKFEELKLKLEREGLFAQERKRNIPFLPKAVGVVTSKTGAVIHDIMTKIRERMPSMQVYLVDARVQGEGAAQEIAAGVRLLNQSGLVDVIIVARGGGSLEDLWAFNEEPVVRAVFASALPVVSGVGHEVDVSLCDLAADLRAPTPTAAAEMVVPKKGDLLKNLSDIQGRFLNYERWLQPLEQSVDDLDLRFNRQMELVMRETDVRLKAVEARVKLLHPKQILENNRLKISSIAEQYHLLTNQHLNIFMRRLESISNRFEHTNPSRRLLLESEKVSGIALRLENLAPQRVLQRGYAMVEKGGKIVRKAGDLASGDVLNVTLAEGRIKAEVV